MPSKRPATDKKTNTKSVYSNEEEKHLKRSTETGKKLCEICSDELSISVEGDYAIRCSNCGLEVHKECVLSNCQGKVFTCDLCLAKKKIAPKCEFCPVHSLRSMKKCSDKPNTWAHITCITYLAGAHVNDDNKTYTNHINKGAYARTCMFCNTKEGAVCFCQKKSCKCCFHVLCGRMHGCVLGWDEEKDRATILCPEHGEATYASLTCEVCQKLGDEEKMLLCDGCDKGFHIYCLSPPLKKIPKEDWYCPACLQGRIKAGDSLITKVNGKEETVTLSSEYISSLIEHKNHPKRETKTIKDTPAKMIRIDATRDADSEEDSEEEEGLGFYEVKKKKKRGETDEALSGVMDLNTCIQTILQSPPKHIERGKVMRMLHMKQFPTWKAELLSGFNLMLSGLGSKYNLLTEFVKRMLEEEYVLTINGFNPAFTLSEMLFTICDEYLRWNRETTKVNDIMNQLPDRLRNSGHAVFLVIHNLDGVGLRNERVQDYLSRLAVIPNCHIIASVDHVRMNLLFSNSNLSNYGFINHDATTFEPYFYEKMYVNQLNETFSGRTVSGVSYVLSSLTKSHLKVLQLLSRETEGAKGPKGPKGSKDGLPFSTLYDLCLCEMLISSEKSLQLIMKELEDHDLVSKSSGSAGPQECYKCCVSAKELKAFVT